VETVQPFPLEQDEDVETVQPFPLEHEDEEVELVQPFPLEQDEDVETVQPPQAEAQPIPDILNILNDLMTLQPVVLKPLPEPYKMRDPHLNDDLREYVRSLRQKRGVSAKRAKATASSCDDDSSSHCSGDDW
jgi:hypothetical protein